MFEDEEFDLCLDFSDNSRKSSNPETIGKVPLKEDSHGRNEPENCSLSPVAKPGGSRSEGVSMGQVFNTQKSIFSLNDSSDSESEILDISLGLDRAVGEKEKSVAEIVSDSELMFKVPGIISSSAVVSSTPRQINKSLPISKILENLPSGTKTLENLPSGTKTLQNLPNGIKTLQNLPNLGKRGAEEQTKETEQSRFGGPSSRRAPGQEEHQFKSPDSIRSDTGLERSSEKNKSRQIVDENPPKRRFPGPAGLLPRLKPGNLALVAEEDENEDKTEPVPDVQSSQENVDENTVWIKALDDLGMRWGDPDSLVSKYNVGLIKRNAAPGSSIRMPILVARIKNLDTSSLDPICRLRDPHGEVGGSIHRDVIEQFGPEIQVGSILVLRNVIVLMTTKSQYVNITSNNMVSIYRPDNVAHIHRVDLHDMERAAVDLEKVRQEQLRRIKEGSDLTQTVGNQQTNQHPAFSVPGQQTGRLESPQHQNLPNGQNNAFRAHQLQSNTSYQGLQQNVSNDQNNGYRGQQQNLPNGQINANRRQQQNLPNGPNNEYRAQQIQSNTSYQGQQQNVSNGQNNANREQQQNVSSAQNNSYLRQQKLPNAQNNGYQRPQQNMPINNPRAAPPPNLAAKNGPMQMPNMSLNSSFSSIGGTQVIAPSSGSSDDGFRLPATPQQSTSKFVFRSKAGPSNPPNANKPLANSTNILRSNQSQEGCFSSSQVLQKIGESFRTPPSQNIPESSQNLIASMMDGLDSDSLFGDF